MAVTLRQIDVFLAVVDHGGFSAAADQLGMSQSAVSHTVAALEREVRTPVVQRGPAVAPTAFGDALLAHARAVQAAARALEARVSGLHTSAATGTVRLAAAPTAAHRLVPGLLRHWKAGLPGLDVRLFEGTDAELADWLRTGAVDAAVLIDPGQRHPEAVELARDDFRAVLRRDHPLAAEPVIRLPDLLDDPLLVSAGGCEPQITALHAEADVPYRPAQRVHTIGTLLGMVEAGLGVAVMPSLAHTMLGDALVMVPLTPRLGRVLVLTGPARRPWHPLVHRLCATAASAPAT
ncbi:LysR family transcriptional regulator [Streptomyces avicenniae]|uniref:LysR family transcriptional regulator n=1 Tax=Streptomyces avicenniae TaxID=500153 RepID=UPI00069A4300|nr:LysR family transcriptional regulator [Streptomyces avicenniae]